MVAVTAKLGRSFGKIGSWAQKPKMVEVEILGPQPRTEKWTLERAEDELPVQARYVFQRKIGKAKVMYCVFAVGESYYPPPLDRKEIAFFADADESGEHLENITTTTNQLYHMEKQEVRRKRYARKGSAMAKAQQTMYVLLAGGLGFLLFIIFSEVTEKAP